MLEKIQKKLLYLYLGFVGLSVLIVCLFEFHLLPSGECVEERQTEFLLQSIMSLLTICLLPLMLRLFKFQKVASDLQRRKENALSRWGTLRLVAIGVLMFANTLLYYLFANVSFGYLAIIVLLASFFIFPSLSRCKQEIAA